MQNLQQYIQKFNIVFHDGSSMSISEQESESIFDCANNAKSKFISLQGKLIAFGSIAKILPAEEYYRQYPEKAPPKEMPHFDEKPLGIDGMIDMAAKRKSHLESMIRGIKRFIGGDPTKKEAIKLLEKMEAKMLCSIN